MIGLGFPLTEMRKEEERSEFGFRRKEGGIGLLLCMRVKIVITHEGNFFLRTYCIIFSRLYEVNS